MFIKERNLFTGLNEIYSIFVGSQENCPSWQQPEHRWTSTQFGKTIPPVVTCWA